MMWTSRTVINALHKDFIDAAAECAAAVCRRQKNVYTDNSVAAGNSDDFPLCDFFCVDR
jgi:hypothetical protein